MPVPNLTPELPLRAKVRTGEKNERGNPVSRDYFICDDAEFRRLAGEQPRVLRVHFPYETAALAFPAGLEKWQKSSGGGQLLGCYTKGDGVAHRLTKGETNPDGTWKLNPTKGSERREMPCAAQRCVYFGKASNQGCRPQARLNFQLVDGPRDSVYRFETKGLGSIEQISGVLAQYADLRGLEFELYVEMKKSGAKQFPVVGVREAAHSARVSGVEPLANGSTSPEAAGGALTTSTPPAVHSPRQALKDYLIACDSLPWPPTPKLTEWIKEVGPEEALRRMKAKYGE